MSTQSTKTTDTKQTTDPWAPQAAALQTAFTDAGGALKTAQGATAPTDFTAQLSPEALAAFRQMVGQGTNLSVPNSQAGTAAAMTGAGTSGVSGALTGLGGYDPTALNNTDAITRAAGAYVNGRDIDAEVNDAMLNARQTARDITKPQIEQNAAATGNTNSTRTGIADGLVDRGLAEQSANLGASLRSQAYDKGLQLASSNADANNSAKLGALSSEGSIGNGAVSSGVNAGNSSVANQGALTSEAAAGGAGYTAAEQARLDNLYQQYQSKVGSPFDALKQYMGIVGTNNWGSNSTGTSTETKQPSAWDTISGLLSAGGSAAQGASKLMAFSDERLKHDITRIGTLDNGLPLYAFRYTFDPQQRLNIGLMAQDVERVKPEAVYETDSGYKMVDYALACA